MRRDPLSICREYLGSSSQETRRKAVAALEAIAELDGEGATCGELIAERALRDPSESVRQRAEQAIPRLAQGARAIALERLHAASEEPATRLRAHTLLTRLRNLGEPVHVGHHAFGQRLRMAFAVRTAAARERGRTFPGGVYRWCWGFTALGSVLACFLIAVKMKDATSPLWLVAVTVMALALAPLLVRAACASAEAGDRYLHRGTGWLAELLGTGTATLPVFAGVAVVLLAGWPSLTAVPGVTLAWFGLGILVQGGLVIVAIRAATLSSSVLVRRSWWGTLAGALAGWGAGLAMATATLHLAHRGLGRGPADQGFATLAAGFWLLTLPAAAGVAAAFARLERDAVVPARLRRRTLLSLPGLLGLVLVIAGWAWLFWPRSRPAEPPTASAATADRGPSLAHVPAHGRFDVGSERSVLRLWRQQAPPVRDADAEPLIQEVLDPGGYRLEIVGLPTSTTTPAPAPPRLFRSDFAAELFDVALQLAHLDDDGDTRSAGGPSATGGRTAP